MAESRGFRRLPLLLLVAALTAPAAWHGWNYLDGRGQVFVAPRCDSGGEHIGEVLHLGQAGCFALLLDDPIGHEAGSAGTIEMSVRRTDVDPAKVTATQAWPVARINDQILFNVGDTRTISDGQTGRFTVAFRMGDETLGEREFEVVE